MKGVWVVGYAALIMYLLTGCTHKEDVVPVLRESIDSGEDTAVVEQGDLFHIENYDGVIVPVMCEVVTPDSAVLDMLLVTIGDSVQEGDVLAVLHKEPDEQYITEQPDLWDQAKYEIDVLKLDLELARAHLKVYNSKGELSSEEEMERKLLLLDIEEMEKDYELLVDTYSALNQAEARGSGASGSSTVHILAPCSGVIAYRTNAVKGEAIPANATLFCIAQEEAMIESDYISTSQLESADRIYTTVNDTEIELIPLLNTENSDIFRKAERKTYFLPKDERVSLKTGNYIPIYIVSETKKKVCYVPVEALKSDMEGNYVYVISDEGREVRRVTIGMITISYVEIIWGVEKGEIVLVSE